LEIGGKFMFTCLDGKSIFDKLKSAKFNDWGDSKKYIIRPKFTTRRFMGSEEIEILLPFSNGELYTEYMVNSNNIKKEMKLRGLKLESDINFSDAYLDIFKKSDPENYKKINNIDKEYLQLLKACVYIKEKEMPKKYQN